MNAKSRAALLISTLGLGLAAGPLSAQLAESDDAPAADLSLPSSSEIAAPAPPARPQVPFASAVEDEVVVYGRRDPLGLPDSVRTDIWRSQRREMQAMLLERERMSNKVALEGFDALLGTSLRILPTYDPANERRIEYGVNDSAPVGLINIFGGSFGKKNNKSSDRQRDY
ncbi:MAG: hypothetical protein AAF184_02375 [Pseudomonadota bacterium]